jgi:hypothetical protein
MMVVEVKRWRLVCSHDPCSVFMTEQELLWECQGAQTFEGQEGRDRRDLFEIICTHIVVVGNMELA